MIGYPYGQPPRQMLYDGFGNPLGQCRLIAVPVGKRSRPIVPRVRLRFNFGEPEFGAPPSVPPPQMLYDGLGNPLGLFPAIPAIAAIAAKVLPLAAKALPLVTKALPAISKALPIVSAIPAGAPGAAPAPAAPPPPTLHSPTVQMVAPGSHALVTPPPCPPPTLEQCRLLYTLPPLPAFRRRRRRPRIVKRVR